MILGTHTSDGEQNYLMIAEVCDLLKRSFVFPFSHGFVEHHECRSSVPSRIQSSMLASTTTSGERLEDMVELRWGIR